MPKLARKVVLPAAAIALALGVALTASQVSAHSQVEDYPSIVQRLVEQFGLNEAEVRAVFDEARKERLAQMQTRHQARLEEAVENGVITQQQLQLLLEKHQQMREAGQERSEMTRQEREADRQSRRVEMEAWAEANGINLETLHEFMVDFDEEGEENGGRPERAHFGMKLRGNVQ